MQILKYNTPRLTQPASLQEREEIGRKLFSIACTILLPVFTAGVPLTKRPQQMLVPWTLKSLGLQNKDPPDLLAKDPVNMYKCSGFCCIHLDFLSAVSQPGTPDGKKGQAKLGGIKLCFITFKRTNLIFLLFSRDVKAWGFLCLRGAACHSPVASQCFTEFCQKQTGVKHVV